MHRPLALILAALVTAEMVSAFESAMIYAAIGDLIKDLGDATAASWLVTIYLLVSAAAAAIVARLGDMHGRRRVLLWVLAIVAAASAVSAATSHYPLVLFGRAVQGLAGAIMPLCFGLARETLPERRIPLGIGAVVSGATAGSMLGLIIGGRITDLFGWHAVFFASALFAALAWIVVRLLMPSSSIGTERQRIDYGSALLFVPGLIALLFAVSSGQRWGWFDPSLLAIGASGLVLLSLWVFRSLRIAEPLIDLRLLAMRPILIANAAYALLSLGALQVTLVVEILLQAPTWTGIGLGISAADAGIVKAPSNLVALVAGLGSGLLLARFGGRAAMVTAGLVTTGGWILAAAMHGSPLAIGTILCLINVGTTIFYAATPGVIIFAVPPSRTSEATGMLAVVRALFMGIGSQIVAVLLATSTVVDPTGATKAAYPTQAAFLLAIGFIVATCLAATAAAVLMPRRMSAAKLGSRFPRLHSGTGS